MRERLRLPIGEHSRLTLPVLSFVRRVVTPLLVGCEPVAHRMCGRRRHVTRFPALSSPPRAGVADTTRQRLGSVLEDAVGGSIRAQLWASGRVAAVTTPRCTGSQADAGSGVPPTHSGL